MILDNFIAAYLKTVTEALMVSVHPPLAHDGVFLALATISRQPVSFPFPWPNFHNH